MNARYSAIRFEQAPEIQSVDSDELILSYLKEDVIEWLAGNAEKLAAAKASIASLRNEMGYTPFALTKLFSVRLVDLLELMK